MFRRLSFALLAACVLSLSGCDSNSPAPATLLSPAADVQRANPNAPAAKNFVAPLSGDQEVPAADTRARGNTTFQLREDGLHYRLIVANLQNVTMAHIHVAPAGVNGPVAVWLYPSAPPPQLIEGRFSGVLATGVITEDDLVGPLQDAMLDDLLDLMRAGGTYVNVHTNQFPGGEIRGQIRPAGPSGQ
jgi:hypothetical protein